MATETAAAAFDAEARTADRPNGPGHVPTPLSPNGTDECHQDRGRGGKKNFTAALQVKSPPPRRLAQCFSMDDDDEAPAAARPAPVEEAQPQAGIGRHGGIGHELVLTNAVPQGYHEAETALPAFLMREEEKVKENEKEKAMTRNKMKQVKVQEILEVQGKAPSHAVPQQVAPQERNSKRNAGQVPQVIPQERIVERMVGRVPQVIPPRRISERIQKQIVDVPGLESTPQKRISERIQEQSVDVPGLQSIPQERMRGTSSRPEHFNLRSCPAGHCGVCWE